MIKRWRKRWLDWRLGSLQVEAQVLAEELQKSRQRLQTIRIAAIAVNAFAVKQIGEAQDRVEYYEWALRRVLGKLLTIKRSHRSMDIPRAVARPAER